MTKRHPPVSRCVTGYLNEQFSCRHVCCRSTVNWPPRSPDLGPLDYHVWGYIQNMVYYRRVDTKYELRQRIVKLQDTWITPQFCASLHVPQWKFAGYATKLTVDILNNYFKQCKLYNAVIPSVFQVKTFLFLLMTNFFKSSYMSVDNRTHVTIAFMYNIQISNCRH
jgi:hypothetical protein